MVMQPRSRLSTEANRDYSHLSRLRSVLVEEDASIRRSWQLFFAERGMDLLVFGSAESFLKGYRHQEEPVEFFFDQDFGIHRGVGLRLAHLVRNWRGRIGTSLVTAYRAPDFEAELKAGVIDAVLPKFPEEIFGPGYFEIHIRRQIQERGAVNAFADSLSQLCKGLQLAVARTEEA